MPRRNPGQPLEFAIERLKQTIAAKLRIEPERLKFGPLPGDGIGMRGTAGAIGRSTIVVSGGSYLGIPKDRPA